MDEKAHEEHHVKIEEFLRQAELQKKKEALLKQAAQKAARTGNRTDLHNYLKLRKEIL